MNERFSMKEFTPLTFIEKRGSIEEEIAALNERRQPLILRKKEIEGELSEFTSKIRSGDFIPGDEYKRMLSAQNNLKREKLEIEKDLMALKSEISNKKLEMDRAYLQSKRIPDGKLKEMLLELREKYMSFSSDTTRVSSMRAMSAKFIEEIQLLLKYVE